MYLQVTNLKLAKFNQIRTTLNNLKTDLANMGWNMSDCSVIELRKELVDSVYKGVDGKTSKRFSVK
jgi:hypothetical protein